jgi:UDP-GlcNAc:undecaprenyl-phosphate GlcNAc-1-phosphate transferase
MGDTGSMLIGMLLAYGPIASNASLDPGVLINYQHLPALNRFPTILPILLPVAILIVPYTDFFLAVIRRTARGHSPFAPDRKHLHHRLQSMGHSHRQSVLLMYLWAGLFAGAVVGLSVVRTELVWLGIVTLVALIALLFATIPQWRPWRWSARGRVAEATVPAGDQPAASPPLFPNEPATPPYPASSAGPATVPGANGYRVAADGGPYPFTGPHPADGLVPDDQPADKPAANGHPANGAHRTDETAQGWPLRDFPAPPKSWRR